MSSINFQHSGWSVCEEMQSSLLFHHACAVQVIADFFVLFIRFKKGYDKFMQSDPCLCGRKAVEHAKPNRKRKQTQKEDRGTRNTETHATQQGATQSHTSRQPAPVPAHALPSPELQWSQRVGCLGLATLKVRR